MTALLRTLRLDPSDGLVFERAAEPGEWAVPGGFEFLDEDPAGMAGKRRQAFRAGFLGLSSLGWSTLVEVAACPPVERARAVSLLADHLLRRHGAPGEAEARAAAEEEVAFAEGLCRGHEPGTVIALERRAEGGEQRERFRTLHRRAPGAAPPVFALVESEEEAPERPDLALLARGEGR